MRVVQMLVTVIDFDDLGSEEIKNTIENQEYPNHCMSPKVHNIQEVDIGKWSDDHPLNCRDTSDAEYARLLGW